MNYILKMIYSNFFDYDIINHNGEDCLVLPMEKNGIYIRNKKIGQTVKCVEKPSYLYNNSHFCTMKVSKKVWAQMVEDGIQPRIIGNLSIEVPKFKFDKDKQGNNDSIKKLDDALSKE